MWLLLIGLGAFALFLARDDDKSPGGGGGPLPNPPPPGGGGTLPGGIPNPWPGFPLLPPPNWPAGVPWPPVLPGGTPAPGVPTGMPPLYPGFPTAPPPGWPAAWPWPGAAIPGGTPGQPGPQGGGGAPGTPWPGFPTSPPPNWPAGVPWIVPSGTSPTPQPGGGGTGPNGEPATPKPAWWPPGFDYPGYIPLPQWPGTQPTPGGVPPLDMPGEPPGSDVMLDDISFGAWIYAPGKKLAFFLDKGANSAQQIAQGKLFMQQNPSVPIGVIHAELSSSAVSKQAYNVTKLPTVIAFNGVNEIGRRDKLTNAQQLGDMVK